MYTQYKHFKDLSTQYLQDMIKRLERKLEYQDSETVRFILCDKIRAAEKEIKSRDAKSK